MHESAPFVGVEIFDSSVPLPHVLEDLAAVVVYLAADEAHNTMVPMVQVLGLLCPAVTLLWLCSDRWGPQVGFWNIVYAPKMGAETSTLQA